MYPPVTITWFPIDPTTDVQEARAYNNLHNLRAASNRSSCCSLGLCWSFIWLYQLGIVIFAVSFYSIQNLSKARQGVSID